MLLLALALGATLPLGAQQRDPRPAPLVRVVGRVTVVARSAELEVGMSLAEQADGAITWPGLSRVQMPPFTLIVVRGDADYARFSRGRAPQWGGAVTLPSARIILLRADAGDPLRLFKHELAHLALHESIRVRVPRWFDEGFATWAAGEFDRLDAIDLHLAVAGGTDPTLADVNRDLASPVGNPTRAYALASTAVLLLARRHPSGTLQPLLAALARGTSFDAAVQLTTGLSLDRFEEAWASDVRHRYGALAWALGLSPWIAVFGLAAAGAVLRRRRDAPRRAALDVGWVVQDDEADPPPEESPKMASPSAVPEIGTADPA